MYITLYEPAGPRTIHSEEDFEDYKKGKILIEAAGGLVFNEKNELLMIFRRDHWDLPKGKIDEGENSEECALREVTEETGLKNLQIIRFLQTTYHVYEHNGDKVIKVSHWYEMKHTCKESFEPQLEEDITLIEWVPKINIKEKLNITYPNIVQLLNSYFK